MVAATPNRDTVGLLKGMEVPRPRKDMAAQLLRGMVVPRLPKGMVALHRKTRGIITVRPRKGMVVIIPVMDRPQMSRGASLVTITTTNKMPRVRSLSLFSKRLPRSLVVWEAWEA